jgi:hypothetical protein
MGLLAAADTTTAGSAWPWLIAGALVLLAAGGYAWWRRRSAAQRGDRPDRPAGSEPASGAASGAEAGPPTIEELRATAAAALVTTDDALRSSRDELGVARSEFGEDEVEPFAAALDQAQDELDHALGTARQAQELAEDEADADAERPLLEEIIAGCASAGAHLDALAPRFDALRDLEARVGELLVHLGADLADNEGRLSSARTTAGTLMTQYPRATIAVVLADVDQATEWLAFAKESIRVGEQLVHSDRRGSAARARAAEEALVQAGSLLDSVDRSPKVLAKAEEAVTTLLAQSERDIADAERLGVADDLAAKGRFARETLGWAGQEVSTGGYDPLEMRRALQDTDVALGRALGPIRPADDTLERDLSLLASAWYGARAAVRAADELITTRRAAVGLEARVRLSEARSHQATGTALGDSDPTSALRHLRAADALAYQARTLAQQDEAAWRNARMMGASIGDLDSVLLGGILIESGPASTSGVGATRAASTAALPTAPNLGPPSFGGPATRARRVGHGHFQGG